MAAAATLGLQIITAQALAVTVWWAPVVIGLFVIGAVLLLVVTNRKLHLGAMAGFSCVIAAILLTPGVWSGLTTLKASGNQSLPSAYAGRLSGGANRGGLQVSQALLDHLKNPLISCQSSGISKASANCLTQDSIRLWSNIRLF